MKRVYLFVLIGALGFVFFALPHVAIFAAEGAQGGKAIVPIAAPSRVVKKPVKAMPDLVVSSMEVKSIDASGDSNVKVLYSVKNMGNAVSGASTMNIDFGAGTVVDQVPAISPGGTYQSAVSYKLSRNGKYTIKATADYNNRVSESNEVNNQNSMEFSFGRTL